ncbi:pyridoxal-5'-phosphate-dependent protein subunit beta [Pedobacter lusitanus]|uniref:Pyridoxal-5'-phosphate-dependent protein subunit beta n=1 Tax=Pedobacter lusitanus TaxID=1503925 RepID=A0A0D0GKJ5_9SPHI|nr:2,3-diaminopropionate biosynthesis protein SbnA [Pedobacter lusitanus]KIO74911.1 pyridoxal-5'-phosphate-dependent protein subunit beta [Pedobacter lusitanus]
MLKKLEKIKGFIGNTPLKKLEYGLFNLFVKLEYCNFTGSSKDRAAFSILKTAIQNGLINEETLIVGSSSGNFAIAVASMCKFLGLKFIPVIDPNINPLYEKQLELLAYDVVKVTKLDITEGYLLTRIETVEHICKSNQNSFCADQYNDPNNYKGYWDTLGVEIAENFDSLDYIFIGVSSGGTITGVSKKIKEKFPNVVIVAVDVEGSVIFSQKPIKRYVSGIGASKVPSIIHEAIIDDVIHVSQPHIVTGCYELLNEQALFAGASSGAVYYGIKEYFQERNISKDANVLFICPDRGNAYMDTIYNAEWVKMMTHNLQELVEK